MFMTRRRLLEVPRKDHGHKSQGRGSRKQLQITLILVKRPTSMRIRATIGSHGLCVMGHMWPVVVSSHGPVHPQSARVTR